LVALVDFVAGHDLAANVEPVHWGIRLLVPPGSLLLGAADFDAYDPAQLAHPWTSSLDGLQARVAAVAEAAQDEPAVATFRRVAAEIRGAAGLDPDVGVLEEGAGRPRLTEAWFCCAEPTCGQLLPLGSVYDT
jgi:hypothetical protein